MDGDEGGSWDFEAWLDAVQGGCQPCGPAPCAPCAQQQLPLGLGNTPQDWDAAGQALALNPSITPVLPGYGGFGGYTFFPQF
jgi:hypothetical protein